MRWKRILLLLAVIVIGCHCQKEQKTEVPKLSFNKNQEGDANPDETRNKPTEETTKEESLTGEAAKKKADEEEEAARKKALEDEAARKKAAEEASEEDKAAQEEDEVGPTGGVTEREKAAQKAVERKKALEEAAKKAAEEATEREKAAQQNKEAGEKTSEEEAARKKALEDEAAKKKADEDETRNKPTEETTKEGSLTGEAAKKKADEEAEAAKKKAAEEGGDGGATKGGENNEDEEAGGDSGGGKKAGGDNGEGTKAGGENNGDEEAGTGENGGDQTNEKIAAQTYNNLGVMLQNLQESIGSDRTSNIIKFTDEMSDMLPKLKTLVKEDLKQVNKLNLQESTEESTENDETKIVKYRGVRAVKSIVKLLGCMIIRSKYCGSEKSNEMEPVDGVDSGGKANDRGSLSPNTEDDASNGKVDSRAKPRDNNVAPADSTVGGKKTNSRKRRNVETVSTDELEEDIDELIDVIDDLMDKNQQQFSEKEITEFGNKVEIILKEVLQSVKAIASGDKGGKTNAGDDNGGGTNAGDDNGGGTNAGGDKGGKTNAGTGENGGDETNDKIAAQTYNNLGVMVQNLKKSITNDKTGNLNKFAEEMSRMLPRLKTLVEDDLIQVNKLNLQESTEESIENDETKIDKYKGIQRLKSIVKLLGCMITGSKFCGSENSSNKTKSGNNGNDETETESTNRGKKTDSSNGMDPGDSDDSGVKPNDISEIPNTKDDASDGPVDGVDEPVDGVNSGANPKDSKIAPKDSTVRPKKTNSRKRRNVEAVSTDELEEDIQELIDVIDDLTEENKQSYPKIYINNFSNKVESLLKKILQSVKAITRSVTTGGNGQDEGGSGQNSGNKNNNKNVVTTEIEFKSTFYEKIDIYEFCMKRGFDTERLKATYQQNLKNGRLRVEFKNGCGCKDLKIECFGYKKSEKKKEIYNIPFCKRKVIKFAIINSGEKITLQNIPIETSCYSEIKKELYYGQLIKVDPNNICVEKKSGFTLTEDSYSEELDRQYRIAIDKPITVKPMIADRPMLGSLKIKTCVGLLEFGKVEYEPKSMSISRDMKFGIKKLKLKLKGDVLSTFTNAKISFRKIVELLEIKPDMLEGKKKSFVVGKGIIVVMIENGNEKEYGEGTTIEDLGNDHLFMLKILMNGHILKLKIGDLEVQVHFKYDSCSNPNQLFSECKKIKKCNGEFKEKCKKCMKDHENGILDQCGECFKDKNQLEDESKCICTMEKSVKQCSICESPKIVVKNGDNKVKVCRECEAGESMCKGKCEASCKSFEVNQLLHGLVFSDSVRNCKMKSISDSDECQLEQVKKGSIKSKWDQWKITSKNCPDKKYKVICDEDKESEEFDYKKREKMSCSFESFGIKKLVLSCENVVGIPGFSGKLKEHDKIVKFSKMDSLTETSTTFKATTSIHKKDTLILKVFGDEITVESPEVECEVPKLLQCQSDKIEGFKFTFNTAMKINEDEEDCGKLLGSGEIAVMTKLNYNKLGKCFAAACPDNSFDNTYEKLEGNCEMIRVKKGCSELEVIVGQKSTVVCMQNSVKVEKEKETNSRSIYSVSKLNKDHSLICEIKSADEPQSFEPFTYTIEGFITKGKCFELIQKRNQIIAPTVVTFTATHVDGQEDPVEVKGRKFDVNSLRNFGSDKKYRVCAKNEEGVERCLNVSTKAYSVAYKGETSNHILCKKALENILGNTFARLIAEREIVVVQKECSLEMEGRFSKTMFPQCNFKQSLHCSANLIDPFDKTFTEIFKSSVKAVDNEIPRLRTEKRPKSKGCDWQCDIVGSNIDNVATNVELKLKILTTGENIDMDVEKVCPLAKRRKSRRCCFNDKNVLKKEGAYKIVAELKEEFNTYEMEAQEITFDYKKEKDIIVTFTPLVTDVMEMGTLKFFVETNIQATSISCKQVAEVSVSDGTVTMSFVIQDKPIYCTFTTALQVQTFEVDASIMSTIKPTTQTDDELKKICDDEEDDERKMECMSALYLLLAKRQNQNVASNTRRKRRAVDNNTLCEPSSEKDCFYFKYDIHQKVKYSVGSEVVYVAEPAVCPKTCLHQVPCQQSHEIINNYFLPRLSNNFNSKERQFFSCGYSAVIYPFQMNDFSTKSVSTFMETLPKIQQSVILEYANDGTLEDMDNEFVMYKYWYFDGSETDEKFEIGESLVMFTSQFQSQYEIWECNEFENCTGIYFTATKMKLYYNSKMKKYEDPMSILSYVPVTPLTDVHIIHFFWKLNSDIGEVKINPSGMYELTMKLQINDFNGKARCHSYSNETQSWEPSSTNAKIDADMVTCECPMEGPCAVFEVFEDNMPEVITTDAPEVNGTTKMPEGGKTDVMSGVTMSTNSKVETEDDSLTTKEMTASEMKTTEMTKPDEQTSTKDTQPDVTYAVVEKKVAFTLQESFDEICKDDKKKCKEDLCKQVKEKLPLQIRQKVTKCDIYKGSIVFILVVSDNAKNINATMLGIKNTVLNNQLVIKLPDGSLSTVDKNSFDAGDHVTPPTPKDEEEDEDHLVIIIVVSVVLSIGLVIIIVVVIVMCKKNKQKVVPSPTPSYAHMTKPSGHTDA